MPLPAAVRVLQRDPDLAADLSADALAAATPHAIARILRIPPGEWSPGPEALRAHDGMGLLVLDGLLVRRFSAAGRSLAELLGAGDVVRPAPPDHAPGSLEAVVSWRAVEPTQLAVLDRRFARRIAPWPEILTALARRSELRADSLSFQLAVTQLRRVEDRLLATLWRLADRWGTVTPHGIALRLRLTHGLLAAIVGVHRPTVTLAARRLIDVGLVAPGPGSSWLLLGAPHTLELSSAQELLAAGRAELDDVVVAHVELGEPVAA